jgi:hypothetical protein
MKSYEMYFDVIKRLCVRLEAWLEDSEWWETHTEFGRKGGGGLLSRLMTSSDLRSVFPIPTPPCV